ncbi:MAG: AbrB/MazE/SpoVT family DNA-binding domain-containing protein [Candidatus Nanoarchaeia archaeon]
MIEIKTKLRRWGNSLGVVVPLKKISKENIKEGDEVTVFVNKEKKNVLKETFGTLKVKKSTDKIMGEIDKDLDSEF